MCSHMVYNCCREKEVPPVLVMPSISGKFVRFIYFKCQVHILSVIGGTTGALSILEHLTKSYGIDSVDQLDIHLASFFDFNWKSAMSVQEYVCRR